MKHIAIVIATIVLPACAQQPARKTYAVVVDIGPGFSPRWDTDKVQITAKTSDGMIGMKSFPAAKLHCHAGQTIPVLVQGMAIEIGTDACIR